MQRIAVQQKERKYLFLNKHFTTGIPKEPKNLRLPPAARGDSSRERIDVSPVCRGRPVDFKKWRAMATPPCGKWPLELGVSALSALGAVPNLGEDARLF